jgi:DNA-binding NtrC family response regulator
MSTRTTPIPPPDLTHVARRRDRRQAMYDFLAALTNAINPPGPSVDLRTVFESAVRQAVPLRAVHLREAASSWTLRQESLGGTDSLLLDVVGPDHAPRAVLEAIFETASRPSDWQHQFLEMSARMGAFVLEIERARRRPPRINEYSVPAPKREAATILIGSTPVMQVLRSKVERVAGTDFTVLLEGESGVGKELVARQIHECSRRRNGPFVAINCAALVETLIEAELFGIEDRTATGVRGRRGKFEHARGGTLFLDEVSDLSLSAQAKLLRAIQDLAVERVGGNGTHRLDIRIVAATNRSLHTLVERQLFRPDLYYRLSGVDIRVPTLRERRADIPELARHFLARHRATRQLRLSAAALDALATHDWPGNVRELERSIERSVALAGTEVIEVDDLPPTVRGDYALAMMPALERDESLRAWGRRYARLMLDRCGGNKRQACRVLDISYHTLQAYLRPASDSPPSESDVPGHAKVGLSRASEDGEPPRSAEG